MKEFRGLNIEVSELIRNFGKMADLRTRARPIDARDMGGLLPERKIRAVWPNGGADITGVPVILIGSDTVLMNFLSKMLSLPGGIAPVTAFTKVWNIEDIEFRDGREQLSYPATLGFIGLVIGELFTTVGVESDLNQVGMDGVRRTLSFACAQSLAHSSKIDGVEKIVKRWAEASMLTGNNVNTEAMLGIADLSNFLFELSKLGGFEFISPYSLAREIQFISSIRRDGDAPDLLKQSLSQVTEEIGSSNSREKRFDLVMEMLSEPTLFGKATALEKGFLISLIAPGSFDFLELAKKNDLNGGGVAASYCACTAILGGDAVLRQFNGFGLNVLINGLNRDSEALADISIMELRILNNSRRESPIPFRTRSPWLVDVELAPNVIASFGNKTKRKITSKKADEEIAAAERDEAVLKNLMTAIRALEDAHHSISEKGRRNQIKANSRLR
ncbi:hypothetical protein E2K99_05775 [Herbaspirillum huttiense]|uniref:hypothetical protein n=1 Tax=Herbaspirillum huttiense TaxID=863372 RepID=UPI0010648D3A|nr:hypothetical protein [Herbaspirillum huttiense]QBP74553.1 hypothetical protein E2K99_05775 [Herbaspirillum huttiense]